MNTLKFEVYKNTLKRRDGFNPVLGEKNYTKIKCYFVESDWDKCTAVTANFMSDKDNIVKSTVSLTADDKTAVFDIPSGLEGDKICFSLTGSYADDSGNTVTLNTNLVGINRQKGMLPSETVNFELYEQMLSLYNKMNVLYNQLKTEKISKSEGSIVTAYLADGAVTKAKLSSDLNTLAGYGITDAYTKERTDQKLAQKLNSMPFDSEPKNNSPCYLTSGTVYNALLVKADKSTTLAGYGITDAYTKEKTDQKLAQKLNSMPFDSEPTNNSPCYLTSGAVYNALLAKADKASTLAGYGIINAYTKTEVLNLLAKKEDNSNKVSDSSQITDCTQNYPSIKYLTDNYWDSADSYSSDEVDTLLNAKADNKPLNERLARMDMSIGSKYDSSNIELGTATLTPYSTQIDKIKSATCLYEKIGDIVIVNVTVIMNATSLDGTSSISLLNMPFSNKSDVIVHDIGISKNGGMFRGSVTKSAWLQFTPLNKQAYNFVADEQVNFSLIYKI